MTDVRFYHLQRKTPAQALPEILGRALGRNLRVLVRAPDDDQVNAIDAALWSQEPASFLPHGTAKDGRPEDQPIWITTGDDNPNGATMLVLVNGAPQPAGLAGYEMVCEVFDGNDDAAVETARARWKGYKDQGHAPTYFQQDFEGKWQKK